MNENVRMENVVEEVEDHSESDLQTSTSIFYSPTDNNTSTLHIFIIIMCIIIVMMSSIFVCLWVRLQRGKKTEETVEDNELCGISNGENGYAIDRNHYY